MRILARLNHPGLVAIYDAGVQQGPDEPSRSYLVMELVDGPSLASQLAAGLLPRPGHRAAGGSAGRRAGLRT